MVAELSWRMPRHALSRLPTWELWRLPRPVLTYILAVHAATVAVLISAGLSTHWRLRDLGVFAALSFCGAVTIEVTRRISVPHGAIFYDMQAVWYIAAAALLPAFYVLLAPLVVVPLTVVRMRRGVPHRRLFTGSACGLAFGAAAAVFGLLPHAVAGPNPGSGLHVATWLGTLACCGWLGLTLNNAFVIGAIKLSDRSASVRKLFLSKEAATTDLCQLNLAVLIALPAAFSPLLLVAALPVVAVMRRFLMHAQLLNAARVDAKTGLLNAAAWQREAELEVTRAIRTRSPLAIAIADIDHFKNVNDTRGHLAGDAVLALVSATMSALLRDYDLIGRFGGEEFSICLPHTGPAQAMAVAERLREKISQITAETPGRDHDPVHVTISVGVATLESSRRSLDELIAAADAALYRAKAQGRNKVRLLADEPDLQHGPH